MVPNKNVVKTRGKTDVFDLNKGIPEIKEDNFDLNTGLDEKKKSSNTSSLSTTGSENILNTGLPDQTTATAPDKTAIPENDYLSGTDLGSIFTELWGKPTTVKVGDIDVDMTKVIPGPLTMESKERKKQGQELAKRVLERNISDQDAFFIGQQIGKDIEQVRSAINKPQTFSVNKSKQIITNDFDETFSQIINVPVIGDVFKSMDLESVKKRIVEGDGDMVSSYYNARKKLLSDQISDVDLQISKINKSRDAGDVINTGGGVLAYTDAENNKLKELSEQKKAIEKKLSTITEAADQVQTAGLNKKFDVPDKSKTVVDFNIDQAEKLGMKKLELLNPVAFNNLKERTKAGYSIPEQTRFGLAKAGFDMRTQAAALNFEAAEENARPVLDIQKQYSQKLNELQLEMNKEQGKSIGKYNSAAFEYKKVYDEMMKLQNNPAISQYQQSYNELKNLVDSEPKLSDKFPEVRREEMTRVLQQAFSDMTDQKIGERSNPLLHPVTHSIGSARNLLSYIFNEEPDEADYKKLAEKFDMTVPDVKRISIGNMVMDQGFSDDQIKKGAEFFNMGTDKFKELSARDPRFRNPLITDNLSKAMGVSSKTLTSMSSGMEDLEGLKEDRLRVDGLLSTISQGAYRTFQGINQTYNRYFGNDKMQINIQNELIDKKINQYQAKPDNQNLFGTATVIDTRKIIDGKPNPTYLREIINEKAGEFNLTPRSFVQTVGDTVGQMSVFAGSAAATGRVLGLATKTVSNAALGADELSAFKNISKISDLTERGNRFGELFGTVASGYAMSYDQHYRNAMEYSNDENKLHQAAAVNAFIEGMSELILPDVDIAKAIRGDKSLFSVFNKIITKDGGVLTKNGLREYAGKVLKTLDIANKEGLEEVIVEPMQAITNKEVLDKDIDWNQVYTNAKQAYVTAFIGTIPTAVGGGIGGSSRLKKESLFEAGNEPTTYTANVQELLRTNKIDQTEANNRIRTINTMADIVRNLPKQDGNGNSYSVDQKIEMAAQEFRVRKNNQIIESSKIEAVVKQAEDDKSRARDVQDQILSQADTNEGDKQSVQDLSKKIEDTLPVYKVDGKEVSKDEFNKGLENYDQHDLEVRNDDTLQDQLIKLGGYNEFENNAPMTTVFSNNKNKKDEVSKKQTGTESQQSPNNGPQGDAKKQTGTKDQGQQQDGQSKLSNDNTGADAGAGISLSEKSDLYAKAKAALPEIKIDVLRFGLEKNMEQGLKEVAQQINNHDKSASDLAKDNYGPVISEIALQLFPDEKAPAATDEDAMNPEDVLPTKPQQSKEASTVPVVDSFNSDDVLKKYKIEEPKSVEEIYNTPDAHLSEILNSTERAYGDGIDKMTSIENEVKNILKEKKGTTNKQHKKLLDDQIKELNTEHNTISRAIENKQLEFADKLLDKVVDIAKSKGYDVGQDDKDGLSEYVLPYLTEGRNMENDYNKETVQSFTDKLIDEYFNENKKLETESVKTKLAPNTLGEILGLDKRSNVFNFHHPLAEKTVDGIVYKIAQGDVVDKKKTYDLYKGDELIGNYNSVDEAKKYVPNPVNKLDAKQQKLADAKAAFLEQFKKGSGNLTSGGIDPVLLEKGVKLVGAYIEVGIHKFGDIVRDVVETFGERSQALLDAMKKAYVANLVEDDNPELDDFKTVKDFTFSDLAEKVPTTVSELEAVSSTVFEKIKELKNTGHDVTEINKAARKLDGMIYSKQSDSDELSDGFENLLQHINTQLNESTDQQIRTEQDRTGTGIGPLRADVTEPGTGEGTGTIQDSTGQTRTDTGSESSAADVYGANDTVNGEGLIGTRSEGGSVAGDNSNVSTEPGQGGRIDEGTDERIKTFDAGVKNYNIADDESYDEAKSFNVRKKYEDNIAVLLLIRTLSQEGRLATPDEQKILAKYVGWGGLKDILLDPSIDTAWHTDSSVRNRPYVQQVYDIIKSLDPTGDLGYMNAIKRSTANAHYTSFPVIKGIWEAIQHLGFKGGHILEPSAGIGNFYAVMPQAISKKSELTAVELEPLTAKIYSYLFPKSDIRATGLQNAGLAKNNYDLVISNVPFGDIAITDKEFNDNHDKRYRKAAEMIHNYFFAKSMELVAPGGVMAFITSTGTMDASTTKPVRELLAEQGEFLGSVRLPNNAFKGNANTEVVTDIIIMRKYDVGEQPKQNQSFLNSVSTPLMDREGALQNVSYNQYYQNNPDQMIGTPVSGNKLRFGRPESFDLMANEELSDLEKEIAERFKQVLPKNIIRDQQVKRNREIKEKSQDYIRKGDFDKIGNMVVLPGGEVGIVSGETYIDEKLDELARSKNINPDSIRARRLNFYEEENLRELGLSYEDFDIKVVTPMPKNWGKDNIEKAPHIIEVRDLANKLLYAEHSDMGDLFINGIREELNQKYDQFVSRYGKFNDKSNKRALEREVDQFTLMALEVQDKETKFWRKSDIFFKRTINPTIQIEKADSLSDALLISLQEFGNVDMDRVSELLNKPVDEIINEQIESEVPILFQLPDGSFESKDEYLTGDVKTKLEEAKRFAESNEKYGINVRELEKIIPADVGTEDPMDVYSPLHARWIPIKHIKDFFENLLKISVDVVYDKVEDKLKVNSFGSSAEAKNFEIQNKSLDWVLNKVTNNLTPKVSYKLQDGSTYFDEVDTELAKSNIENIKREWDDWKYQQSDRRNDILKVYNNLYNREVLRSYDGSHLTFPGLMGYELRPHQKDAVWRFIQTGGGIMDHMVGGGKTLIMAATAMEKKRLGIAKKPMIIGLKSQIPQLFEEFKRAYPLAKVLFPTEKDFSPKNRKRLLTQIATNDWDAIIIGHSQFDKLNQNPDIADTVILEMKAEIEEALDNANISGDKQAIRKYENKLEKITEKAKKLRDKANDDDVLRFDQLGVDDLTVDESQEYKNLEYSTSKQDVRGLGNQDGAKRAFNLLIAARYLQKLHGSDKGLLLSSGTPISNTIAEMYLLFKYLTPNRMSKMGIRSFDQWASTFAEDATELEYYLGKFKEVTRFRKFKNLSELLKWYRSVADVRNSFNLILDRPKAIHELVKIPISENQKQHIELLQAFIASKGNVNAVQLGLTAGYDDQKNMNPAYQILAMGYAKKLSLDMRLLNTGFSGGEKVNIAADNIVDIYKKSEHFKGTQLIFSDLGTPKSANKVENLKNYLEELETSVDTMNNIFGESYVLGEDNNAKPPSITEVKKKLMEVMELDGPAIDSLILDSQIENFNVYQAMKDRLVSLGIPENEIEFIHSHNSRKAKEELYKKVNAGDVRILLGSTGKMGVGVNVQERAVADHHLDMPWRPSDLEQRNGRIERQKNIYAKSHWNNEVNAYYYATERTLDASLYENVSTKAKFIQQIKVADINSREEEDIGGDLSLSEMASELSGDPDFKARETLNKQIKQLENSQRAFNSRKYRAQDNLDRSKRIVESTSRKLTELKAGKEIFEANAKYQEVSPEKIQKLESELGQLLVELEKSRNELNTVDKFDTEKVKELNKKYVQLVNKKDSINEKLGGENDPLIFNPVIGGVEYDSVGKAGTAVLEQAKELYKEKKLNKEKNIGELWGFNIMAKLTNSVWDSGRFFTEYRIVSGDNTISNETIKTESGVHLGRQIKEAFTGLDRKITNLSKNIADETENIPRYEDQLKDSFPDEEKLKQKIAERNEVDARIKDKIKTENDKITGKNSGGEDEDYDGPKGGDVLRRFKIPKNAYLMSTIIPGLPQLWNAAVEVVATGIDAGLSLADAMRKGYDYIRNELKKENYKGEWAKDRYNHNMISELKSKGYMDYDLTPAQEKEAGKLINRLRKGANLPTEVRKVKQIFDDAISKLTDPIQIKALRDSQAEFERYVFDHLAMDNINRVTSGPVDLGLKEQTRYQKIKENYQNRYERMERTRTAMKEEGITIDEKNDMVNAADTWKGKAISISEDILSKIGLAQADIFIWKGQKKIKDSFFDRMSKTGIDDFYRKLGLYMYAKHAPERNAHNALMRRKELSIAIAQTEAEFNDLEAEYKINPTPLLKALVTKKENLLKLYVDYEALYSDADANPNLVKLLENRIPVKMRLMDDGGSGMTNAQAKEIIDEVDNLEQTAVFEEFADEFKEKVVDKILEMQISYGLITPDDYDLLSSYYESYVPLKVENSYFEDEQTFANQKKPGARIFKSKGANYIGFESRINPLSQAIVDLQAVIFEGEQNNYKKTVANAIESAPDQKVWQMQSAQFKPMKDRSGRIVRLEEINKPQKGIPFSDEGGQKKYLIINDEALRKEITEENVKAAIPVLSQVNGFFRAINTVYNPNFTVANLFRDMETAGIVLSTTQQADVKKNFGRNVLKVLSIIRGSYREQSDKQGGYWTDLARDYKESGGNMSWFHQDTVDNQIKNIEGAFEKYNKSGAFEQGKNLAIAVSDFMNKGSQAVETATRLAMYDALLRSGTDKYKAIEIARNATINFHKKGNYSAVVDSLYLFANATIQGSANVLKTMLTTKRGLYMAGGIMVMGMIQSFLNNAFSDCENVPENCYDNIPEYEKERNIIIRVPGGTGFIKIPLAYGFNVFYNMGEKVAQSMQGKKEWLDAATETVGVALNSFNPVGGADTPVLQQVSPTATDPIVQWYTNKDGLGRPIYDDSYFNDKKPDSERSRASNSATAKDLSNWLNKESGGNDKIKGKIDVSPGTFDWIFQTMTGGMGQFIKQTTASVAPEHGYADIETKQIPLLNRFYTIPHEKADKADIFDIKDRSYNEIINEEDLKLFNDETDRAVRINKLDADKADKYKNEVNKNQFELKNQDLIKEVDRSKEKIFEDDEKQNLIDRLTEMYNDGKISHNWLKGYKAEITRNQNKLLKKDEE